MIHPLLINCTHCIFAASHGLLIPPCYASVSLIKKPILSLHVLSLLQAMGRLALNDASVAVMRENSDALGPGFRRVRLALSLRFLSRLCTTRLPSLFPCTSAGISTEKSSEISAVNRLKPHRRTLPP